MFQLSQLKSIKKEKLLTQFFFLSDVQRSASRSHLDRSRVHICLRAMGFKIVGNRKEKRTPSWESTRLFLKSRRAEVEGAVNSYARVRRWVLWPMLSALCPILLQKYQKKIKFIYSEKVTKFCKISTLLWTFTKFCDLLRIYEL